MDFTNIFLLVYALVLIFIIRKLDFFSSKLLSKNIISSLVLLKLIAGIFYIYFTKKNINGGDIFQYFNDANLIFEQIKINPTNYLKLIFYPNTYPYPEDIKPTILAMGFWDDAGTYLIVRFNAIIRLISFGNIYIHGLFAGFFSFIGSFLIMKVFEKKINANKLVLLSIFLSPSILFWTSGIHKEFISVLALGLILYNYFIIIENYKSLKNLFFFCLGIALFFITRNYMLLALIPSLLAYTIHEKFGIRYYKSVIFSLVFLLGFLRFQKIPKYNKTGFEVILEKRFQFEGLIHGNSSIILDDIKPTFVSLLFNSPKALFNTIVRPHFGDINNTFTAFASIESLFYSILLCFAVFNYRKLNFKEKELVVFMMMYSIFLLLIIGWIVPNLGAINRYRSISLVVFIPTLLFVASKK